MPDAEAGSALAAAEARNTELEAKRDQDFRVWLRKLGEVEDRAALAEQALTDREQLLREIAEECEKRADAADLRRNGAGSTEAGWLAVREEAFREAASLIRARLPDPEPVSEERRLPPIDRSDDNTDPGMSDE